MFDLKLLNGLKRYDTNGYYRYFIPTHHLANKAGFVYEHMLVAEQMLGRELKKGETVHHKDGNRSNNSFDNLMVFKTLADHTAFHKGREIKLDGDVYIAIDKSIKNKNSFKDKCPYCNGLKSCGAKMCLDCYRKQRAKNIPPKEELYGLLGSNSMCAIGRMYGVSDSAVRKWCKKYGLPFRYNDLKHLK